MSENALKKISEKVIGVKRRFNFSPRETVTEIEPFEVEIPVRVIFHLVFIASVQLKYTELNSSATIFFPLLRKNPQRHHREGSLCLSSG